NGTTVRPIPAISLTVASAVIGSPVTRRTTSWPFLASVATCLATAAGSPSTGRMSAAVGAGSALSRLTSALFSSATAASISACRSSSSSCGTGTSVATSASTSAETSASAKTIAVPARTSRARQVSIPALPGPPPTKRTVPGRVLRARVIVRLSVVWVPRAGCARKWEYRGSGFADGRCRRRGFSRYERVPFLGLLVGHEVARPPAEQVRREAASQLVGGGHRAVGMLCRTAGALGAQHGRPVVGGHHRIQRQLAVPEFGARPDGGGAAGLEVREQAPFGDDTGARGEVVQQRDGGRRLVVVGAGLDGEGALRRGRQHLVDPEPLGGALAHPHAVEAGGGEDHRVELPVRDVSHARVDVSAQRAEVQVGSHVGELGTTTRSRSPHARALGQRVQRQPVAGDEHVVRD